MSKPKYRTNFRPSGDNQPLDYSSRKRLLSAGEKRFYTALNEAVGQKYLINLKTRLTDVISADAGFSSIDGKKIFLRHVDFVLAGKKDARIVMAIELDDGSHDDDREEADRLLDDALHYAGIPVARFPIYREYSPKKIAERIDQLLNRWKTRKRPTPAERSRTRKTRLSSRFTDSSLSRPVWPFEIEGTHWIN